MSRRSRWAVLAVLVFGTAVHAQDKVLEIDVKPAKYDATNVPVRVVLNLPDDWAGGRVVGVALPDGTTIPGQLTTPGLMTADLKPAAPKLVRRDLHFILPAVKAGQGVTVKANFEPMTLKAGTFDWKEQPGEFAELAYRDGGKDRPVLRYMNRTYDPSKEKRDQTYKVFHHLYDPAGTRFVTNGGQTDPHDDPKKLKFPHHRGLMYAFNRITYDGGKKADTWHATNGAHQKHEKTVSQEAGPVVGRHRVLVGWYGNEKDRFAQEERELTAYAVPGGTLVEFASKLTPTGGKIRLDGDPQHAGFQFRAANAVAETTAKQTYYLRPDGKGKPGETRNWEPKTGKGPVDLPWDVLSFVLGDRRYSTAYLNHPTNPKESRFSERDYGRFGCYFEYDLAPEKALIVNYRVWLQDGEMTGPQAQALFNAFAAPPEADVKIKTTP